MAFGTHWEWRGFGAVNSKFAEQFSGLKSTVSSNQVVDTYVYTPELKTNIKIRTGYQSGIKFKRPVKFVDDFELWTEREDDLFEFPLTKADHDRVRKILGSTELDRISSLPTSLKTADDALSWLSKAGFQLVKVKKEREIKVWHRAENSVMVEWACLSGPQSITSISLESEPVKYSDKRSESSELGLLKSALSHLNLDKLPLKPMNYLEVLDKWANGNKI